MKFRLSALRYIPEDATLQIKWRLWWRREDEKKSKRSNLNLMTLKKSTKYTVKILKHGVENRNLANSRHKFQLFSLTVRCGERQKDVLRSRSSYGNAAYFLKFRTYVSTASIEMYKQRPFQKELAHTLLASTILPSSWLHWSKEIYFVAQLPWLTALHSIQFSLLQSLLPHNPFQNSPSVLLVNLLLCFKRCFGSVLQWTRRENKLMFMAKGNQTCWSYFRRV